MRPPVFVSTGGFHSRKPLEIARQFAEAGIFHCEWSGGRAEARGEPELEAELECAASSLSFDMAIRVHNYFPAPEHPFVFNLASSREAISQKSLALAKRAIRLSARLGAPAYAFHAGFRFDPGVSELGKGMAARALLPESEALRLMTERIKELLREADTYGVRLWVENNVLTRDNFEVFGESPFLAVTPEGAEALLSPFGGKVGLLMDVAHWNVSARTLGRDRGQWPEVGGAAPCAFHLSENDGTRDSNDPVHENSWFWEWAARHSLPATLEVYRDDLTLLRSQKELAERRLSECGGKAAA